VPPKISSAGILEELGQKSGTDTATPEGQEVAVTRVLELPRDRSVSRFNATALKPDRTVRWANEIAFGWEKPAGK